MATDTRTGSRSRGGELMPGGEPRRRLTRRQVLGGAAALVTAIAAGAGGYAVFGRGEGGTQSPPAAAAEGGGPARGNTSGGLTQGSPYEQLTGNQERVGILAGILGLSPEDVVTYPVTNKKTEAKWHSADGRTRVQVSIIPDDGRLRAIDMLEPTVKDGPANSPVTRLWREGGQPGTRFAGYRDNNPSLIGAAQGIRGPIYGPTIISDERTGSVMRIDVMTSIDPDGDGPQANVFAPFDTQGGATKLAMTFAPTS